ncbi:RNA polymerase, sigma subunit, ECF family [Streptomyces sp. DvalAA-14]|uniref:sigma-70 family RNA polymerase sigma factor n=1 Tax=unclassified Streptomyces TaxID=2593676 RepID=UPI00081B96D4|nr:sigma-70 family RNA polymerase sigma factor [Streptomyces sp. DvalAA-14]SCD97316.1 RNA polymerase, sigma subunit, ECF family [Streptomyces sp. DvalAA-14]
MNTLSGQRPVEEAETEMPADAFVRRAAQFRPELLAHCYRMLGSVQDAEDLVQETYLRAWRAYDGFEGRSSLRFWLYRIATSACLTALDHHSRRFVPAGLSTASDDPTGPLNPAGLEIPWVQPLPDIPPDPAAVVASRGSVRLALIVALQQLPPKQRVVLILRDVLAWRAAEVAKLLDTSTAAVNSALQRARAQLEQIAPAEDDISDSLDGENRLLLDRYAKAFENADVDALLHLLREDVRLEMPPEPVWFAGRDVVGRFFGERVFTRSGAQRLVQTTANDGQPAMATYWLGADGRYHAHALQLLTLRGHRVARIIAFRDPSLFPFFGLPRELHTATPPAPSWSV